MKKLLSGIALGALLATPALAADLPVKAAPAPVAVYNWTGCHIGVQWGFGAIRSDNSFQNIGGGPFFTESHTNGSGALIGGLAGCNYQTGRFVIGFEGDGEWTRIRGNDGRTGGDTNELRARWMASARGRLGYAVDNVLVYVTGGGAWMGARSSVLDLGRQESHDHTISGWTVGGGFEYSFWHPNLTGRFEYRYASFGTEDFLFANYTERNRKIEVQTFRGALVYRFNFGGGPLVARY